MAYAIGWKQDRPDDRDHDARKTFLRAVPPPPSEAMNDDLVKVVDQAQLGSCTVNGTGQIVRAAELLELVEAARAKWTQSGQDPALFDAVGALAIAQRETEFWSRLFAYYLARSFDGDTANDDGTEIRLVFQAINKYGFPPESAWPYSDNTDPEKGPTPFRDNPSANAYRLAYDARASAANTNAKLIDYSRITTTGDDRVVDIKTALAARHLVVFGTNVTEAFCSDPTGNNGEPIQPPTSKDKIAGGHAMAIGGFDDRGGKVPNSWGTSYGGRGGLPPGWVMFSWDYLTWSKTTDLWIVRRAPLLAAKAA